MKIWVGRIDNRYGVDFYTAKTKEILFREIAKYCREWSEEANLDLSRCKSDVKVVEKYFAIVNEYGEYFESYESKLYE